MKHKKTSIYSPSFIFVLGLFIIFWIGITTCLPVYSQTNSITSTQIIEGLEKISENPIALSFKNSFEINNEGGHLQGIQWLSYGENKYYILSGSSDVYSYYTIVKTGKENMVISMNKIMEAPFKHAGGFQVYENLMAIGVEDNEAKNKSKVFIFHLENPEKPPREPLAVIDRMGTFKRATGGCVGIIEVVDKVLVVVGDWDTEHLDFYRIDREKLFEEGATLELEYSMNTKKINKSRWIDQSWLSYQNINFIKGENENLYLAGMTADSNGKNVIDLFLVETEDFSTFNLQKIYTRTFNESNTTSFRWGSGIAIDENDQLSIRSSPENIIAESQIHIYK